MDEFVKVIYDLTKEYRKGEKCPTCGGGMFRSEDMRLKAVLAALDRLGLGPKFEIDITETSDSQWLQFLTDDQLKLLSEMRNEALSKMPAPDLEDTE